MGDWVENWDVESQWLEASAKSMAANTEPLPKLFWCGQHMFRQEEATSASLDGETFTMHCPYCATTKLRKVPDAVVAAVRSKFDRMSATGRSPYLADKYLMELKWDNGNKCYYFMFANMYHGVEPDGHIHT